MNQKNVTIIGFDLGHGEVSLAKINSISSQLPPEVLQLHRKKSQPTAIAQGENNQVLFGEPAMRKGTKDFDIAFKKRPTSDSKYQQNILDLVRAIYLHLVDTDQFDESNYNHFFIGCPSGWSESERKNYEDIFLSIGIKNITVVSESRAALMQAIESDKFIRKELLESILIIDMGSSTTDLTLVENMKDKPIDFGEDIGASLIDKAILEYSITHSEDCEELRNILEEHQHYRNKCEFLCRKAKEEYFCYEMNYEEPEAFVSVGYEKLTKGIIFEPLLNKEIMDKLLQQELITLNGSWISTFTNFLFEAKQKLESNSIKPNVILLTGGASKMGFVSKIVKNIFYYSSIKRDSEPETCIAKGLAQWGKIYIKTESFIEDFNLFLNNDFDKIIQNCTPDLIEELSEFFTDSLLNIVTQSIKDWREQKIDTLNKLEPQIQQNINSWIQKPSTQINIRNILIKWFNTKLSKRLDEKTNIIYDSYEISRAEMQLPIINDLGNNQNFNNTIDINKLSLTPDMITNVIIVASYAAMGVGMFLGPVGWIVGIIGGMVSMVTGLVWTESAIKNRNVPGWIRSLVTDEKISSAMFKKREEIKSNIKKSFQEQEKETVAKLIEPMRNQVKKAIQEKADQARLLIS